MVQRSGIGSAVLLVTQISVLPSYSPKILLQWTGLVRFRTATQSPQDNDVLVGILPRCLCALIADAKDQTMKILIAEDNWTTRLLLEETLAEWGYEVLATSDGAEAWQELQAELPPQLVLLDWKMPAMDGVEVCQRVRERAGPQPTYIILLTANADQEDIVVGLEAGADDYIIKPFDPPELRARLHAGKRVLELQQALTERVRELEAAMASIKHLQGLLPICAYCKRIRDDKNYWQQVEAYITSHSEAQFSHSVCPDCHERLVKPQFGAILGRNEGA
jgi:sigma-B regulation protein RsbU (phosphoserine phosphatase)